MPKAEQETDEVFANQVLDALEELSDPEYFALVLRHGNGLSYEAIARWAGITEDEAILLVASSLSRLREIVFYDA